MTEKVTPTPFSRILPTDSLSLKDVLDEFGRQLSLSFNCHVVAQIQSFDERNQTCVARINYQKTIIVRQKDGSYAPKGVNYPILVDVPVIILSGGTAGLTFPIAKGDDCLILFNDRDIDTWISSGQVAEVNSNRLHDLNDGFALVGIRHFKNSISGYETNRAKLFNGSTFLAVSENEFQMKNSAGINFGTELSSLCTQLSLLANTLAAEATLSGTATYAGVAAQIAVIQANLGSLMP